MLRIKGEKYHVTVLVHGGAPITIRLYYGVECSRVSSLKYCANSMHFCVN